MPVIVHTRVGVVREVFGSAVMIAADGSERPVQPGDMVRAGDVILTRQNSFVEIVQDVAPILVAGSTSETDQVISALAAGDAAAAPAAGLAGGDGSGLGPGLRVDRIQENLTPGTLQTLPTLDDVTTTIDSSQTNTPEDELGGGAGPTLRVDAPDNSFDTTPTITGSSTLAPGRIVTLTVLDAAGSTQTFFTTVNEDGSFSADVPRPLAEGDYTVVASGSDNIGRVATDSDPGSIVINLPLPPVVTVSAPELTDDNTPTVTGTTNALAGSVVTLTITDAAGTVQTVTAVVRPDGSYSVDVATPLVDGPYVVVAIITTAGGTATATDNGIVDTTAPAPTITLDAITGDDVVNVAESGQTEVTLSGRVGGDARPGDTVTVTVGGQDFVTTVAADGSFAVLVSGALLAAAVAGGVSASVTSTDAAGNAGRASIDRPYTLDAAPVAVDDSLRQPEDGPPGSGDLTPGTPGQDRDPEGGAISVSGVVAGSGTPGQAGVGTAILGDWGAVVVQADGRFVYRPGAIAQSLRAGETVTDTFSYAIVDAQGNTATAVLTVTLVGANDLAVIGGDVTGRVVEDGVLVSSGVLTVADADAGEAAFRAQTLVVGDYGRFSVDSQGRWSYTLDNDTDRVQALAAGETVTETFTVTSSDGTTRQVTVTVVGTDDAPVVSADVGSVVEDLQPLARGVLTVSDIDSAPPSFVATAQQGDYGGLAVASNGQWRYTLGAAAQALAEGEVVTDVFTVALSDGSTTTVTITVTGTDDAPVVSRGSGQVVEDDSPSTSGRLTATDVDGPPPTFVAATQVGDWGSLVLAADGRWTYTLAPAAQALAAGEVVTEVFTVALSDGSTTTVTITVIGTDDLPVVSSGVGAVIEDEAPTATGILTATDVDNPALAFVPGIQNGGFGALTLAADGSWRYTLGPAAQALGAGEVVIERFTVDLNDGSTTTVTITVTGTDDPAVIPAVVVALTETNAVLSTGGTLVITDPDGTPSFVAQAATVGTYGSFTLAADGTWTYSASSAHDEFVAGQVYTDIFTVTSSDGSTSTVTINITGTNDPAVIPPVVVELTETDAVLTIGGVLAITDPDSPLTFVPQTAAAGTYGSFTLAADGTWTYTASRAHDEFVAGLVYTDRFTVTSADGSTSTVTINITGTNDPAVIPPVVVDLTETDAVLTAGGLLAITDPDSPLIFVPQTAAAGTYGSFTLAADGTWTYTASSAHDEFVAGQVYTDTFTVTSVDGPTSTVTVNITGANDPAVIPPVVVELTETDAVLTTGGVLTLTDPDSPLTFVPQTEMAGTYGSFTLAADGTWTYTASRAHDEFVAGQVYTDRFTVTSADGSTSTVTVNITGTNDPALIPAVVVDLIETDAVLTTGGVLTLTDPDSPLTFVPQTAAAGTYGSFTLAADGTWTYTATSAHDEFAAGQVYTDRFAVTSADGSTSTVTINITGTNDPAVIPAVVVDLTETDALLSTGGVLTLTDPDSPLTFVPQTAAVGNYGSFTLAADGTWAYTALSAHDEFVAGQVYTDAFTVTSADGSTSTVTVNITGTNDPAVIPPVVVDLTETNVGLTIGGVLALTDPDSPLTFVPQTAAAGTYGSFTLAADGAWTYTASSAHDEFVAGQVYTDRFTVTSADGSTSTVTVNITGTNDPAAIPPVVVDLTETNTVLSTGGVLVITDPDSPLTFVPQTAAVGTYGSFTLAADGTWTYTASSAHDEFVAGRTYTDTFTVSSADGSTSTVTINIAGTNDVPVAGNDAYTVAEDGSLVLPVLANDTDIDPVGGLTVLSFTQPTFGRVTLNADGSFSYRADPDFYNTTPTFATVVDSALGLPNNVFLIHDEQVASAGDYMVAPPRSLTANSITTLGRLPDGDFIIRISNGDDVERVVSVVGDGDAPDFVVTIPANSAAILNIGNVASGAVYSASGFGGTATVNNTVLTLTSPAERFTYTVSDGQGGTSTATVDITVTPTNDAPFARSDSRDLNEDVTSVSGQVIRPTSATSGDRNDTDQDGDALSVTGVAAGSPAAPPVAGVGSSIVGSLGTLVLAADGSYTYTPGAGAQALNVGQTANDVFTYAVSDGKGGLATTTLTMLVTGSNDAPVAVADTASAREAGGVANGTPGVNPTGNVLSNDTDIDGVDTKTVTVVGGAASGVVGGNTAGQFGTLVLAANGSYTYTVNNSLAAVQALQAGGATLTDTFSYTMRDAAGQTSSTTLTVTIAGSNDAPVAAIDTATLAEDGTLAAINVLANDSDVDAGTVLRVTSATSGNGVVAINPDNTLRFVPTADFNGVATIRYTISDGLGGTATSTVRVTVTPVNDAPTATAAPAVLAAVSEDNASPPGAAVSALFGASFGDVRDSGNPSQNQFAGVAVVGNAATAAQGRWQYSLDGGTSWQNVGSTSDSAAVALRGTDLLRFLPAADYNGTPAPLSARLLDNSQPVTGGALLDASVNGGITPISTGVVVLNTRVVPVNDPPVAPNSSIVATEEGADVSTALALPFDIDSPTLTVRVSALPSVGQIILKNGNTETVVSLNDSLTLAQVTQLFYRPPQDHVPGADVGQLALRVSDGKLSSTGQVNITVLPVDDAPVARPGSASGGEDGAPVPVALRGTDVDSTVTAVTVTTLPGGGLLFLADGVTPVVAGVALTPAQAASLRFVPNTDFNGKVSLQFTVTSTDDTTADPSDRRVSVPASFDITITPVNDAPVAAGKTVVAVEQGVAVSLGLAAPSDVDDATTSLIITVTQVPSAGVVLLSAGDPTSVVSIGQFLSVAQLQGLVYLPPLAYDNAAVLVPAGALGYEVTDNKIVVTAAATIDLQPFNDAPTAGNVVLRAPQAGLPIEFALSGSDVDGSIRAFIITAPPPAAGRLELLDGTPFPGGTLSGTGPLSLRFIPAPGFNGTTSFSYQVVDNGVTWPGGTLPSKTSAVATVQLDYTGGGPEPVIRIEVDGTEDTALPFTTVNAGAPGSVVSVTDLPDHGSLTYPDGTPVRVGDTLTPAQASSLVYTPNPNFNGEDTLGFAVTDSNGVSTPGELTINIEPVPDRPVAVDDTVNPTLPLRPTEDIPYRFKVLGNDFDVDGQTAQLRVTSVGGQPIAPLGTVTIPEGTVTLQADGTLLFVPRPDFNGPASFSYGITDPDGLTSAADAVVRFNVLPVNDAPKAVNDSISTNEDTAITVNLAGNDTDPDGDTLFVSAVGQGANGSVTLRPDGTVTYTPNPDFFGTDTFTYTVADGKGGVSSAVVTVTVRPVNDAPIASNTQISGTEDTPISGRLPTASDVDGDAVTYARAGAPAHGSVVINADGGYVYTPNDDYFGADRFSYTVSDGKGGSNTYTVDVTLRPVNDAPDVVSRTLTVNEEAAAVNLGAGASDVDPNDSLTVSITALPGDGLGQVLLNGVAVSVGQQLSAAELARLTYLPPLDYDGSVPAGAFRYTVSDGLATSIGEIVIDLQPVNDAPVNTVPGARTVLEDTPLAITGLRVADVDALSGTISVTLAVANGSLQVSGGTATIAGSGTGSVTLSGTLAQVNATLAASVVYTGKLNFNGADTLTMTTNDGGNTGSGGARVDIDVVSIAVSSVNDAPSGSDSTISMAEDGRHTFSAGNFGFSDSLDTPPNALAAVIITTLPTAGRLTLAGAAVAAGQSVSAADLAAGRLVFAPADGASGNNHASFTFQVRDNGGTASGGVDRDPTPNTIAFDVRPVNDAPSGSDATIRLAEDGSFVFAAATFGFSDALDAPANHLAGVLITALPTAGLLTLGGAALVAGQVVSVDDITAGRLVFTPAPDANGNGYGSLGFRVRDDGGTSDGGVDTDPTANTLVFNVTAINDAPVARNDLPSALAVAGTGTPVTGNAITGTGTGNVADSDAENGTLRVAGLAAGVTEAPLGTTVIGAPVSVKGVYGSLLLSPDGGYTYLIDDADADTQALPVGARTTDVFSYTITDQGASGLGGARTDTGQLTLQVAGPTGLLGAATAGSGNGLLTGGAGDDVLTSGAGWDQLTGGGGGDTFIWKTSSGGGPGDTTRPQDAPTALTDFDPRAAASGGDVLDLRDLLIGETSATLDRFLDFNVIAGATPSTEIRISSSGGFAGGSYNSAVEDQRIVLEGVDIRASLGLAANASDNLILQTLIDRSKLLVDAGP